MQKIEMVNLAAQYERMHDEIDRAINEVVRSGQYINGRPVADFADALAAFTGARHVVPCANGTDALMIALAALGLHPGDEVIIPDFTFIAAAEVIALLRLVPVPVDVNPDTFNIDPEKITGALSRKTKAIIPVHLFGQSADMTPIMKIARENSLSVIEDNAQSIGAEYVLADGTRRQTGTIGNIGTLSFFPTKNLGCFGDGGAMTTDSDEMAERLKMLTVHGQAHRYEHELIGCNSRLDNLQAAILSVKLPHLKADTEARQKIARRYSQALTVRHDLLSTPVCIPQSSHVYNQYTLKIKGGRRDALRKYLEERGVPTMVYYPKPVHRQPAFLGVLRQGSELTAAETLCLSALSLPMHPCLTDEEVDYITTQIINYE